MRRVVLVLLAALALAGCDHEGPTVFDGRLDGPPRDAHAADAPEPDADQTPDAAPPDAPPTDSPG